MCLAVVPLIFPLISILRMVTNPVSREYECILLAKIVILGCFCTLFEVLCMAMGIRMNFAGYSWNWDDPELHVELYRRLVLTFVMCDGERILYSTTELVASVHFLSCSPGCKSVRVWGGGRGVVRAAEFTSYDSSRD